MSHKLKKGHAIGGIVLGALEIVLGLIITILCFVLTGKTTLGASRSPFWAGIIFIVPGILGVISGFTKNRGVMIAFMVINIIAVVIESIGFIVIVLVVGMIATYALATCNIYNGYPYNSGPYNNGPPPNNDCADYASTISSIQSLGYAIVVFLIIAILVALASSILGCIAVCCSSKKKSKPDTVIIQQPGMVMQQPVYNQQQPVYNQQQPVYNQQQPAYPPTYDYTSGK